MPGRLTALTLIFTLSLFSAACSVTPKTTTADNPPAPDNAQAPIAARSHDRTADWLVDDVADNSASLTRLHPDYIHQRLTNRHDNQEIADAFNQLLIGEIPDARHALIKALELDFIHNPETSSLQLLNAELSAHFTEFDWQENDYPGGAEGPNEKLADLLTDALDMVSPERRANRTRTAVIVRDDATEEIWAYMLAQWQLVPGEGDWKLNRYAVTSYVKMREAAQADGVDLTILSGHRDPERARQNAARAGNSFAVASFSSHSLGLAIDFLLPRSDVDEPFRLTTRPMAEVVAMRHSPVHKWLHLYGYQFGWYPFQHEPWHWEFNPPGFREVFFADYPGGPPQSHSNPD